MTDKSENRKRFLQRLIRLTDHLHSTLILANEAVKTYGANDYSPGTGESSLVPADFDDDDLKHLDEEQVVAQIGAYIAMFSYYKGNQYDVVAYRTMAHPDER
jgi:hypothetical protein